MHCKLVNMMYLSFISLSYSSEYLQFSYNLIVFYIFHIFYTLLNNYFYIGHIFHNIQTLKMFTSIIVNFASKIINMNVYRAIYTSYNIDKSYRITFSVARSIFPSFYKIFSIRKKINFTVFSNT